MKNLLILLSAVILFSLHSCNNKLPEKPNIIYILADDLGYGDLSCYGQTLFSTPNIDRMASEGMRFVQHYSGSTVCAPSRSSLMTGLHTGHTQIRGNRPWKPEGQWPIADSAVTVAEALKEAGYATGAFGKWGLGFIGTEGDPNNQGFDEFYGYNCQRIAHNYYPYYLWDNSEKVILEGNVDTLEGQYAPDLIHAKALEFIEEHQDEPFFLYYPSVIPHAELKVPDEYMNPFRNKFLPEKEYKGTDSGPNYKMGGYGSQNESHAAFVGMVDYLDKTLGDVMAKLEELRLEEKTIVFFTSDNGPHMEGGADPKFFNSNGVFRGFKRDLYEGGIRVPLIVSWPGQIAPGSVSEHSSAFWDMFPTFAELAGAAQPDYLDGISIVPSLANTRKQEKHEYLYWEFHERKGRVAVIMGKWKGVRYNVNVDPETHLELYNLETDPGEDQNLAKEFPEIVQKLDEILIKARFSSPVFKSSGLDQQ
ncbi:MAG: arylsulfatase [Bacteroidota bacterium]|nr:arylsulfatase [Bacteroidota bacterium]